MGIFYMRRTIETVPRDGSVVVVEDDASVTYDLAHWSPEAGQWVGEDGEPSKITPTHWHPLPGENYLQQGHDISSSPSQAGPSASRARRYSFFPFSAGRAAAAASNVTAPRSVEMAAPATVEAFEAQTAPVEAKRARRFAVFSIAATFVAAALIGRYFRAEIAAYVTPYPDQDGQDSRKTDSSALRHQEASTPEARQSLEKEQRTEIQEAKDRFDALSR